MASMKDVAARAGVSISTVSHVLNNTRFVSPATLAAVQKAIGELGFHPNAAARLLASGASDVLGLIISDIANPFFPEMVKSFEAAALAMSYEIALANTNYAPRRTVACVERMIMSRVRGLAVMTSEMEPELMQKLRRHRVPVVYLDSGAVDVYASNIVVDYPQGIRQAVAHLADQGHTRIGFVSGPDTLRSARRRRSAFEQCMAELGMRPLIECGDMRQTGGEEAGKRLLQAAQPPTGILAANDLMAFGVLRAVRAAGLRVPEDISVAGFDDILFSAETEPPLTTVDLSRPRLGAVAAEALRHLISSPRHMGAEYRIGTQLITRASTGPAPRGAERRGRPTLASRGKLAAGGGARR